MFRWMYKKPWPGILGQSIITDGLNEMGFSQAGASVNNQRIVIGAPGGISHSTSGCIGKIVSVAYNKIVEGVPLINPRVKRRMCFCTPRHFHTIHFAGRRRL